MATQPNALGLPNGVAENAGDPNVQELARIWWVKDRPSMMLRPAFPDSSDIGVLLAETAWHFSEVYAARDGSSAKAHYAAILSAWVQAQDRMLQTQMTPGDQA